MKARGKPRDFSQSERLEALLADCNNEWEQLATLEGYLEEHLQFPFQAVCDAPPEPGSSGIGEGDRVSVLDFLEPDRQQGIMVRVKKQQRIYRCPLFRLRPFHVNTPQAQSLLDYRAWFRAVGLPEIEEYDE